MDTIQHILLTTDLSVLSQAAFPYAAGLAKAYDARITLMHVDDFSDSEVLRWETTEGENGDVEEHIQNVLQLRTMLLEQARKELEGYGVTVASSMQKGHPVRQILSFIRESHVDLMVLAKHGSSGFKRLLIGSTSTKVIRKAKIPVLVVDSSNPNIPSEAKTFNTILTTTDFSMDSSQGLQTTLEMAQKLGAHTQLINVLHLPQPVAVMPGESPMLWPPSHLGFLRERARDELNKLMASHSADNLSFKVMTSHNVIDAILEAANACKADLIVMPSHGKGAVVSALVGSTTMSVLKLSEQPVLILPPEYIAAQYRRAKASNTPNGAVILDAPPR